MKSTSTHCEDADISRQTSFPGDHRDTEPPESISNSEVKSVIADDSVGFPHVKVGHYQVIILKSPTLACWVFFWNNNLMTYFPVQAQRAC